jgi:hypothetical protein
MLTTFDESYDNNHNYLILGALFNPRHKIIQREFAEAKRNVGFVNPDGTVREIKYSLCTDKRKYEVAKIAVDCFINSHSFFRAIVIDQKPDSGFRLDYFGKPFERKALKEARAYKKFTELLLKSNLPLIQPNGLLYADKLTRCKGDAFCQLITELFGTRGTNYSVGHDKPIFKHISEVDTSLEDYHLGQIGDILQGVILNELKPGDNRWKNKIRNYVKGQLKIPSLLPDYWGILPKWHQDQKHPKYQVWYWRPEKE